MKRGDNSPQFRPTVSVVLPRQVAAVRGATVEVVEHRDATEPLLRVLPPFGAGYPSPFPRGRVVLPSDLPPAEVVPYAPDYPVREVRTAALGDVDAVAAFVTAWGWSWSEPLLIGGGAGFEGEALTRQAVWKGSDTAWSRLTRHGPGLLLSTSMLRSRVILAAAVADIVRVYQEAVTSGQDSDTATADTWTTWAGLLPGWAVMRDQHAAWDTVMTTGLRGVPLVVSSTGGPQGTRTAGWFTASCLLTAWYLEEGRSWRRCANERAHGADGGWFTVKRTKRRRDDSRPHRLGVAYCSDSCEKATNERARRERRRMERTSDTDTTNRKGKR